MPKETYSDYPYTRTQNTREGSNVPEGYFGKAPGLLLLMNHSLGLQKDLS